MDYEVVAGNGPANLRTAQKDDPEFSQWLKNLDKLRKIASDSLYQEI
jgi:hypothetical protein